MCTHLTWKCVRAGGFTFSGENESMIHNAAGSFSRLRVDDDDDETNGAQDASRRSSKSSGSHGSRKSSKAAANPDDDGWEDER